MTDARPAAVLVLAAGQGSRMKSATAKVLHRMCGRTLLGHVLSAVEPLKPERTVVVVGGPAQQSVQAFLTEAAPSADVVVQAPPRGTGHAARTAVDALPDVDGTVLVMHGDTPLFTTATLSAVLARHEETRAAATMLTAVMPDPANYGRVTRDADGHVTGVVEERDATDVQREINEICTGVYAFDAAALRASLSELTPHNAQQEEYLTDVIAALVAGAVMMFPARLPGFALSGGVIAGAAIGSAALLLLVLAALLRSRKRPVVTGAEALIGAEGETVSWQGGEGRVRVNGEIWLARSDAPLAAGRRVRVVGRAGLVLRVEDVRPA